MKNLALTFLLAAGCIAPLAAAPKPVVSKAPSALPKDLDATIEKALKTFECPGAAVAIVKDGQVVLAKGYGVKQLGKPEPVLETTRFQIASNSKAFTAALLAMYVDEGKLKWDDRVIDYLADFRLYDAYVTREFTIRDLLTHRSGLGLGAGDLLWFRSQYSRSEIIKRFREVKPETSFRSAYAYDNVLYIAAGEVAAAIGGKPWEVLVKERIFDPLGMASATGVYQESPNDATPHSSWGGPLRPVSPDKEYSAAAAAGIHTHVVDLAKWVKVQLAEGQISEGKRLWSQKRSQEMWSAVTPQPIRPSRLACMKPYIPNFAAYGLGFELRDYKGAKLVTHTGALTGTTSRVLMVPEHNLGIIVLTNGESRVWDAITWQILDHYLGGKKHDWIAAFKESHDAGQKFAHDVEKKLAEQKPQASSPSVPLSHLVGEFNDAWYGDAQIKDEGGKPVLSFKASPSLVGEMEFYAYQTFKVIWRDRTVPDALATFSLDENGKPTQFTLKAISPLADFSFNFQDLCFKPKEKK